VVLADFNEDVHSLDLNQFFWEFNLVEVVTGLHPRVAPALCNYRSHPINGIFIPSCLLQHCCGGYLDFEEGTPSNHWVIWIDIPSAFVCP